MSTIIKLLKKIFIDIWKQPSIKCTWFCSCFTKWSKELQYKQDKQLSQVVSIKVNGKRTGTGILAKDLMIWIASKCIDSKDSVGDVTIHFPDDKKSYNPGVIDDTGDIAVIEVSQLMYIKILQTKLFK